MSPSEVFRLQDEVWSDWKHLPTIEPMIARKLEILKKNHFKILIVTSTPLRHIPFVKKWLTSREIKFDEFHAIGVCGSKTNTKADALVDDSPNEIRKFIRTGKTGFLYIQPWNQNTVIEKSIKVQSINAVLSYYNLK